MARIGRRPGPSTTRSALLEAARRRFAEGGYEATSVRAIAADAGVDPAVAIHFFGSKEGLFRAAVGWPFDPASVFERLAGLERADLAPELVRLFLGFWDDPTTGAALSALLRTAMTQAPTAALLRAFVAEHMLGRVGPLIGGADAALRLDLAVSQMLGVAVVRHVLQLEPIASAPLDELVAWLTPTVARYLVGVEASAPPPPPDRP